MTWTERDGNFECRPYKVTWEARGYSAWCFSQAYSGCLGHEFHTAEMAKQRCAEHARAAA